MSLDVILDLIVIVCLAVTVGFAVILNKRLSRLYESRAELQNFITQFASSIQKADQHIRDLKMMGETVFHTATEQMGKATALKDDLLFLIERGEDLAVRLEDNIRAAREANKEFTSPQRVVTIPETIAPPQNDDGQPELLKNIQNLR